MYPSNYFYILKLVNASQFNGDSKKTEMNPKFLIGIKHRKLHHF